MIEKSPDAYKTIGEAADELGVARHVLRFWETRFKALKPVKSRNNRRYYTPQNMLLLKKIHHLLYKQGYTIKGAIMEMEGKKPVGEKSGLSRQQLDFLAEELKEIQRLLSKNADKRN